MAENQRILVCAGTGCASSGAHKLIDALKLELNKQGLEETVSIVGTGCQGFCEKGPTVVIEPQQVLYCSVKPEDIAEIVAQDIMKGERVERLLLLDQVTQKPLSTMSEVPFFAQQHRIVLKNCGVIDPQKIEEYIARDGYAALKKVLKEMSPAETLEEVRKSGLRGRGGAGFPTGKKWAAILPTPSDKKYIICNGDEGDPGAFMDRSVLEGDPHSVIEGMLIGAYAMGVDEGYVYCRAEYPLAIKNLEIAIRQAEEAGFLGNNILNSGLNFKLNVFAGAGAFVCGEGSALMASIEGRRGMPRMRPPRSTVSGLFGKPTVINNVETWSNVPHILLNGADWYTQYGTDNSRGTKIFALTGKVNNTGLVEVPMGTTLREIIFDIGGGIQNGKAFKAVQIGGPSGGCIPEEMLDIRVDYDTLTKAGAMVGSGGLVVMDETTCMVDIARFFLDFTQKESCGKCTPCREGTKRMYEILDRIVKGEGKLEDIDILENLSYTIIETSLCGLGNSAPNPILATLKYFRHEFEAHILEHKCPAHSCSALLSYTIDAEKCKGCGLCAKNCPVSCITGEKKKPYVVNEDDCIKCGTCVDKCKFDAVVQA